MSEAASLGGAAPDGATAGTLLREAREAAGLHVDTLAANLKVPVRKLEALEEDRYDLLPDAVFVRALASSVCRSLKVDPQPVLQRLPQGNQPRLPQEGDGLGAPFRAPSDGPGPGVMQNVSRPVVLIVLALLLAAVVLIFLPTRHDAGPATGQPDTARPAAAPRAEPAAQVAETPATVPEAPPGAATPSPTPPAPTAPAAPVAAPMAAAPTAVPAPAPAADAPAAEAPPAATGIVVFRTRGPSWIEVIDARGTTQLRRLMGPGESAGAGGALPLEVTVGDAAQTEVFVRGKPYDLARSARDNVARFEVK